MVSAGLVRHSLKTRITLITLLIFLVGIWSLSFYAHRILRDDMERLLGEQQLSTVSMVAAQVEREFAARIETLEAVAHLSAAPMRAGPDALQRFLQHRFDLDVLFSDGIFATQLDGTAIAAAPDGSERVGVNYGDSDVIRRALHDGQAAIGRPTLSKTAQIPVISIAVPIRNERSEVVGALAGVTHLGIPNFLDQLIAGHYGKAGGYLIIAPQHRLIVTASNKQRVLEALDPAGNNPFDDRSVQGSAGSGVTRDASGVEVLYSFKRIATAEWDALVYLPTSEAFFPIRDLQQRLRLAAAVLTLLAGALTWWLLKRQLSPLLAAANTLVAIADPELMHQPLPIVRQDEIGLLISAFNHLLDTLSNRETALRESEEHFRLIFENSGDAIVFASPKGPIEAANPAACRLFGYSQDELRELGQAGIMDGSDPRLLPAIRKRNRTGRLSGELRAICRDGRVLEVDVNSTCFCDSKGVIHTISQLRDISERKRIQEQLQRIAHYDALTDLPNRVLLADRLRQALAQCHRKDSLVAVVYLDVDDFKTINDSHGHGVGDALLVAVAQRMKDALRDGDTLSRIGGDEFVAVLVNLEQVKSYQPAVERLLLAAAAPVSVDGLSLQVSVSIGVTIYPNDISDADLLLRHADQALYVAKQSGKNRYHLFDVAHDAAVSTLREGLQHLRAAFDQGEFVLHYQPKVNMRSGEVVGAEALIRWQHPQRGLLTPSAFLPLIESDALAVDLGEWVIAKALTQIERWREQGQDIPVSVNIAASHLQRADFAARLQQMLAAHPSIKPGDLAMEVLESSALDDLSRVSQIIKDCQSLGVSFALDDFGTGYSSLTYLKRLPVSLLKIDQSFVRDMLDDPDDLAILEGVIGLSTAFRRDVIAEGVETVEQGELLLELGCEQAQGYGIGRPMPASDFPRWAAAWHPDARWIGKESARREDLPLLFAQIEHRAWLADMEKYLSNELAEPPSLALNQSRFGSWLAAKTRSCHTGRAVFQTAEHAHGKAHALALELCELKAHGRTREALARRDELRTLGDTVLAYLKALREEWPAHQSAIH